MKALALALIALSSAPAFADSLTCTLVSGKKSDAVTLDLNDAKSLENGKDTQNGVYDLSFYINASCTAQACDASLTIFSQKIEDEVGSTGFSFDRSAASAEVFREPLTGAPDKKKYELSCAYAK